MTTNQKQILNKTSFSMQVEEAAAARGLSFMEATIDVAEKLGIELEEVRRFINPGLKDKIHLEASDLNFLPKINQLPVD